MFSHNSSKAHGKSQAKDETIELLYPREEASWGGGTWEDLLRSLAG